MTAKQITKHEARIYTTEMNIERIAAELASNMAHLADRLDRVARCMTHDARYSPNSLGEVQNAGREIDRLCALLHAEKKHLEVLQDLND